jgi:hypothetical protein
MSFQDALNSSFASMVHDCLAAGAVLLAGQFGSTVCQYPDHYVERPPATLGSFQNPGTYRPRPTFRGDRPDRDGSATGEVVLSSDGRRSWFWSGEKWFEF